MSRGARPPALCRLTAPRALFAALLVCGPLCAQDEKTELTKVFRSFDQDSDGVVARKEFPGSDEQFAALDADRNGKVTLAEYLQSEAARALLRARRNELREARPRTPLEALVLPRLEALARFDRNKDGKVTPEEWTGTAAAFAQLDLDRNRVLDGRDRMLAQAQAAAAPKPEPELPEPKGELPPVAALLQKFDKDGDGVLSEREAQAQRYLGEAFAFADRDRDGKLDKAELEALLQAVQRRRAAAQPANARPTPFDVPFDTWDKDQDGRIRQNEWLGPRDVFERIDLDRDSAVTRDEVSRYVRRVTAAEFVDRFDQNGDGKVTLIEFGGPPAAFQRADRNGDGAVTRGER